MLGSALFFAAAPGVVAGLVPWGITRWTLQPAFFGWQSLRMIGVMLIIAGVLELLDSFARFALQGLGTPAPIAPPRHLVVTGAYRYVRNPMYLAVLATVLGQALLLGNRGLLTYAFLSWVFFHAFVVGYEEPALHRAFGTQYDTFTSNVRRWIPRLTPWRAERRS